MNRKLLNEGGSGGHMFHPFNLPSINSGTDLIEFFYKAAEFLARNPEKITPSDSSSLKVDGANTAFKLVRGPSGLEFAFDRGSMFPIDIEGITIDKLTDPDGNKTHGRWPAGHGMISMGRIMLGALNRALPRIKQELIALGLMDEKGNPDTTKFINSEFCWKETNAVKYNEDFVAFHGVNQYYEKDYRGIHRPGAVRPLIKDEKTGKMIPTKQTATEILYDESAMESFKNKVLPYFREAKGPKNPDGFNVYTVIPVYLKEAGDLPSKIEEMLASELTIRFRRDQLNEWKADPSGTATMSLKGWLSDKRTVNPRAVFINMSDGSKKGAMSKEVYGRILSGEPVEEMVKDPESWDVAAAINGALFYYAIENVGATILKDLTSPLGDIVTDEMAHEGVVLRNEELFGVKMVKITGNFITSGSTGKFASNRPEEQLPLSPSEREEQPEQADIEAPEEVLAAGRRPFRIGMLPGAFKPPHRGHLNMATRLAKAAKLDKVLILISKPTQKQRAMASGKVLTAEDSQLIWQQYIAGSSIPNAEAHPSPHASPVQVVYDYVMKDPDPNDDLIAPLGAEIFLGCGDKGSDADRYSEIAAKARKDLKIKIVTCPLDVRHTGEYMELLNSAPEIKNNMPSVIDPDEDKDPRDFHGSDMRYLAEFTENSSVALELFKDFVPKGDALAVLGILGINPSSAGIERDEPSAQAPGAVMEVENLFDLFGEILLQEDFQDKMKARLCRAHDWFLNQGRHDLTKHGGGFHLDPPKCKSNAFVAKESVKSKIKLKLLKGFAEKDIEEASSMGAGMVAISPAKIGVGKRENEEDEEETLIR